jgi:hypothetical protein
VVPEVKLQVTEEVLGGGLSISVLDIVGCIVVHAIKVIGALDKRNLFRGKGGEAIAELGAHRGRIVTQVDGVGEPGDGKLDLAVSSLDIPGILRIPRESGIAVESDTNLTTVLGLEFLAVNLDGAAMGNKEVVADDPGLAG